jgi:hypothetical protein
VDHAVGQNAPVLRRKRQHGPPHKNTLCRSIRWPP